ncbi:MFS transporter, partial [Erysipelothrix rhusiopathiae]|nr:MFS transporter [Erysipelothrix rhusiopathiae]
TISSIIVSVGAALGFFIGGYLGDVSVRLTFVIQAVFQIILGILFYLILGSHENIEEKMEWSMIRNSNPLKVLQSSRHLMKDVVLILLIVTFTSSVGTTLFDQSFNYYIKDIFNFVPSQNGIIKAITGLFAVVLNVILIRRRNRKKQGVELGLLKTVFIAMGSLAIIVSFSQTSKPFVGFALAWFGMYTVMIPILQNSVISNKHSVEEGNQLAGLYNSLLMLGKIFGALLTSLIYTISPSSTFMFAGVIFILSFII